MNAQESAEEISEERQPDEVRRAITSARSHIKRAVRALEVASAGSTAKAAGSLKSRLAVLQELLDSPWDQSCNQSAASVAQSVRKARVAAGLTQEQVASRAGISLSSYRNCERGYRSHITEEVVAKLARVPELGFTAKSSESGSNRSGELAPSWWVDESFEPIKMLHELRRTLNGNGGCVEQSLMYLDHQSATDFIALSGGARYAGRYRNQMPLEKVVDSIRHQTGDSGIDVIALGVGDGQQEIHIVQLLADAEDSPDLKFTLLDISQPLLSAAYRNAAEAFDRRRGVAVFAMQGNFYNLPRFTQLHYRSAFSRRRRVLTMLGLTMCNLQDETAFFKQSLMSFATGDLLVLDFIEAAPKPWSKNDSAVNRPVPEEQREFLGGPIWRYCREVTDVSFRYELGTSLVVPDSYAIYANATVRSKDGSEKVLTMFKSKRYDPEKLEAALKSVGWDLVESFRYPHTVQQCAHIMLLRKRS